MKLIPLTQGKFAMVDDEDYEELMKHKWHWGRKAGAHRNIPNGKNRQTKILMHVVIAKRMGMELKEGEMVDHHDRDKLNNQRCNLRPATNQQNAYNSKIRKDNRTGYKGVCWDKKVGKYRVDIRVNGKRIFGGYYKDKEESGKVRDELSEKYCGEFAVFNIDKESQKGVDK